MVHRSAKRAVYNVNTIYDQGLIQAHIKCEGQMWAGSTIDLSLEQFILAQQGSQELLDPIAISHSVPYKNPQKNQQQEYALRLVTGLLNDIAFENVKNFIVAIFKGDNKGMEGTFQVKLDNTIQFLQLFRG
jgi:hypothetical protein